MVTEEELSQMSPQELAEFQKKNCVFCRIATGDVPARTVYSDEDCIAVLDINPAAKGHMLLMPKEHYSVMPQLPDQLVRRLSMACKALAQAALKAMPSNGTTIFIANGAAAGQRAPHFMIHIIPRKDGDNAFPSIPAKKFPKNVQEKIKDALAAAFEKNKKTPAARKESDAGEKERTAAILEAPEKAVIEPDTVIAAEEEAGPETGQETPKKKVKRKRKKTTKKAGRKKGKTGRKKTGGKTAKNAKKAGKRKRKSGKAPKRKKGATKTKKAADNQEFDLDSITDMLTK